MPSTSPGYSVPSAPTDFAQILPGAPNPSLQAITTFLYRHKRYFCYISGRQLNVLASPTKLVQAITFKEELVALSCDPLTGRLAVAGKSDVYILNPVTEGWSKIWWEKALCLQREDAGDEARSICWGNEGEVLVGGSHLLSLFSTLASSRTSSPADSPIDGEAAEDRRALWSKSVASPVKCASFSPSGSLIATCGAYDRLVKIWRRLSFEEGLFDHTYLPHGGAVTHLEWRPVTQRLDERRGSGISSRSEDDPEVLFTIASDGLLRVWRAGNPQDLDILILHTTIDLVSAIPQSPSLSAKSKTNGSKTNRYVVILPVDEFCAAVSSAISKSPSEGVSHTMEHLKEVLSKSPDVIVTVDGHGRMSAWGLQSVGHLRRPETPGSKAAFHIAHTEGVPLRITSEANARTCVWFEEDKIQALCHDFAGEIRWLKGDVETFFSTAAPGPHRLREVCVLSGHDCAVKSLVECGDVIGFISCDAGGKKKSWRCDTSGAIQLDDDAEVVGPINGHQDRNMTNGASTAENNRLNPNGTCVTPTAQPTVTAHVDERGTVLKICLSKSTSGEDDKDTSKILETGLTDYSILASNPEVIAIASADGREFIIVDIIDGYVEHHQQTSGNPVLYLSCFSWTPGHNLLAVGYRYHVELFAQGRYQHASNTSTWTMVNSISIAGTGLSISDVAWMRDGSLAIAAGNGIVLSGNNISVGQLDGETIQANDLDASQHTAITLPHMSILLKRPLPVWHPRMISHLVRHGQERRASGLIRKLAEKLKFWSEGEDLHDLMNVYDALTFVSLNKSNKNEFGEGVIRDLQEQLDEKNLPAVSDSEQRYLQKVIEALVYLSNHKEGLDHCALRYLFSWRLQSLHIADLELQGGKQQSNGITQYERLPVPEMHWREIAFASHSTTQQPLLDILVLHYDNKLTWPIARSLGVTAWLSDQVALAQVFESLAQSAYRQVSPPDPTNASLFFIALHKKATLLALWRIATWHKEQRATTNFLKRDFNLPDARTAARKNAFALMGKRRFEYAAAFFLLADDAASATSLLAGQCEDIMLAIAVARLYDGDGSLTLNTLLSDRLIPEAQKEGDRWLMSWCHTLLLHKTDAVHCLIKPLGGVRYWHQDDPTTLMLYRHLRKDSSEHEYEAVLRGARILRKMGLWLIALDLVADWKFETPKPSTSGPLPQTTTNGDTHETPSMLDGFDQQPPAKAEPSLLDNFGTDAPPAMNDKAAREAKAAELMKKLRAKKEEPPVFMNEKKKPEPTQFKEPDANSLLDSFGF